MAPVDVAGAAVCDEPPLHEGALPGIAIPVVPPPSKAEVEPETPDAVLPIAEQLASEDVPDGIGLMPPGWNSVAPSGIPVGPTDEPDPIMPSGEVWPILRSEPDAEPIPPTCAKTGLQPKSAAIIAAINTRRIVISIVLVQRSGHLVNAGQPIDRA